MRFTSLHARCADLTGSPAGQLCRFDPLGFVLCACNLSHFRTDRQTNKQTNKQTNRPISVIVDIGRYLRCRRLSNHIHNGALSINMWIHVDLSHNMWYVICISYVRYICDNRNTFKKTQWKWNKSPHVLKHVVNDWI